MTGKNRKERDALNRIADLLVEDILNAPDEVILVEFKASHGDPAKNAASMRALFQKTAISMNKQRLTAARAAVNADRQNQDPRSSKINEIAEARQLLRRILQKPAAERPVTLAARNETELSDSDVLSMLEDLRELGVVPQQDKDR